MSIKVGIIGCGKIAQVRHIPEYAANPDAEVYGFYDINLARAEELAQKYGGKAYASYEELLADPEIAAVSVCAANHAHAEISIAALKAGKHVLCEKPMAVTLEECEAMVAAAKESGKYLMIGQNQRLAKAHAKAKELIEQGVDAIFYPCLTRNVNERVSDNHYNCPVVAYYPEVLVHNMDSLATTRFLYPYLNINDKKELTRELTAFFNDTFGGFTVQEVSRAVASAARAYDTHMRAIRAEGARAIEFAKRAHKRLMVLCGRPYHIDPEIGHGIDKLATSLGFVVVTEDAVAHLASAPVRPFVLNQWTYHARLYNAARFVTETQGAELVQLVSFGCGIDAITTDEVREILEDGGKLYTQIKIDEITNLGAVTIRLRSLLGALEGQGKEA